MNLSLLLPLLVTTFVAIVGWYVAHRLSVARDRANKRRELRVQYLITAYRHLEEAANRERADIDARQFERAIADVQLFGTIRQVELAQQFSREFATQGQASFDKLLEELRRDLRAELDLPEVAIAATYLRLTGGSATRERSRSRPAG